GLLVRRQADLATYRSVFGRFFLDEGDDRQAADDDAALHALPATRQADDAGGDGDHELAGTEGSAIEDLRTKRFDACTDEEPPRNGSLLARLSLRPPPRPGRRTTPARSPGRLDLRRTVRSSLRRQGELLDRSWRDRRPRPRPLVFL